MTTKLRKTIVCLILVLVLGLLNLSPAFASSTYYSGTWYYMGPFFIHGLHFIVHQAGYGTVYCICYRLP